MSSHRQIPQSKDHILNKAREFKMMTQGPQWLFEANLI